VKKVYKTNSTRVLFGYLLLTMFFLLVAVIERHKQQDLSSHEQHPPVKKLLFREPSFSLLDFTIHPEFTHLNLQNYPTFKLPDFSIYPNAKIKKEAFFSYLKPIVETANNKIDSERLKIQNLLISYQQQAHLSLEQVKQLSDWSDTWGVNAELSTSEKLEELLVRVDSLPEGMVLAQAANESGWGGSRFARKANNLFGEWCFNKGCGLVPNNRRAGATHEVKKFPSVEASVFSYIHNINTHKAYEELRALRAQLRNKGSVLHSLILIEGLDNYSERGAAYIEELRKMIQLNRLEALP